MSDIGSQDFLEGDEAAAAAVVNPDGSFGPWELGAKWTLPSNVSCAIQVNKLQLAGQAHCAVAGLPTLRVHNTENCGARSGKVDSERSSILDMRCMAVNGKKKSIGEAQIQTSSSSWKVAVTTQRRTITDSS